MTKINKTEKYISILYFISKAPGHKVSQSKLLELLGPPPRSSGYRLIHELTNGIGHIPAILQEDNSNTSNAKIYKLNSDEWENFVYAGDEGQFFLEAFKKIGKVLNCDYTNMAYNDVFSSSKIQHLNRKFIYINKIESKLVYNYSETLSQCLKGLVSNKLLKITYSPIAQDSIYERIVEPLTLCQYRDDLYLLTNKVEAGIKLQRNYKINRIKTVEVLSEEFKYPTLNQWNPEKEFKKTSGIIGGKEEKAVFRVYGISKSILKEKVFFNGEIIFSTSEYDQYEAIYSNIYEFLGQLFVYAQDIEIISSDHLREVFYEKAKAALEKNILNNSKKKAA